MRSRKTLLSFESFEERLLLGALALSSFMTKQPPSNSGPISTPNPIDSVPIINPGSMAPQPMQLLPATNPPELPPVDCCQGGMIMS